MQSRSRLLFVVTKRVICMIVGVSTNVFFLFFYPPKRKEKKTIVFRAVNIMSPLILPSSITLCCTVMCIISKENIQGNRNYVI